MNLPILKPLATRADAIPMAEVIALRSEWAHDFALATPEPAARAGLEALPHEWTVIDQVSIGDFVVDHVIVGPNGVFTVGVDPDPEPAIPGDDGIYRAGERVTTPVKDALMAAHVLRRQADGRVFAYPILVTAIAAGPEQLDRLGVVRGDRIAEYIWSHPGLPLRRSQRHEILWTLGRPV
jgi:hypothetical protein